MRTSSKIFMGLNAALLIALGIICICNPAATIFTSAWLIGVFTLATGISNIILWGRVKHILPTGNLLLSGVLQIILGCIFLNNKLFVAASLPVIFAFWILVEGISIAIRSFDIKALHIKCWWILLILGIAAAILGAYSLRFPLSVGATALTWIIGVAIICLGLIKCSALVLLRKLSF